jgi:hypothetical protein
MLYRPLFWTAYWCEDWLFSSKYRGANQILITSASSKTAFCLAYLIGKRVIRDGLPGFSIVGLTSKRNLAFTKGLSLYDEVLDYDSFISASAPFCTQGTQKWLYLDVAGNESINVRVFSYFGSRLVASIALGLTSLSPSSPDTSSTKWLANMFTVNDSKSSPTTLEQFFMPEWLAIRRHQLPMVQIIGPQRQAWKELLTDCRDWVRMDHIFGSEEVKAAYENIAKGGLGPDKGLIWSLWRKGVGTDYLSSRL